MIDIDKHLIAYHDGGNDYRYAFSKEEVTEIKKALEFYESALKNEVGYLSVMCERKGYNKAIDDFVKEICKMIVQSENNGNYRFYAVEIKQAIADLAEQLKAGEKNE